MSFLVGINAVTLIFVALCVFAIAYRFYGLWIAVKVLGINPENSTPAIRFANSHDYVKTNKYVLFGHHFAAIAAAGPLLGPILAAQFGYLPGALWILIGCVLGGAVHDMVILFASVRHKGHSLATIASIEVGKFTGHVASLAILFILVLSLSCLSVAVVNAMHNSPWGTFTVFSTIPIAMLMGVYLYRKPDGVKTASAFGVVLLFFAVVAGHSIAEHPMLRSCFDWDKTTLEIIIPLYGLAASLLPIWLLLCPRDYLSTFLKIGTIVALAIGILFMRPTLQMEPITKFVHGGGPIISGPVFPFIFITIACGAVSGFHAIIASGTTPKMISSEREIPFVGYGAMLTEGFVAMMALIAACILIPADYFAINSSPEAFAQLGMEVQNLPELAKQVEEENLQGRTGGAVSLAVGMAYIFSAIPLFKEFMAYWYHFAIMFEAVFILTAVDAGTRVGRFFLQEMIGRFIPKFADEKWLPGVFITSILFTGAWGYLQFGGKIEVIWPLFGLSNQLLAACALVIATSMIIRMGKARYAWVTGIPGLFMVCMTLWAGCLQIFGSYLPSGKYLLGVLGLTVMSFVVVIFFGAVVRWIKLLAIKNKVKDAYGDEVLELVEE
ncbi:MAG: carbon starvation protein A [Planctomycetaceae bacterium]|jgi:carbon starvation protein|nr:carbon starvation protein A [Planctomycetaceae bacterium]